MSNESLPFLSVIIPAHNEEKTICKIVDSVILQDYFPFEIIVVDDGSDDDTGKNLTDCFGLCQIEPAPSPRFLKHKSFVKLWDGMCNHVHLYLIQKENGGKGDALNAGIDFCHGDFFVCTDADCVFSVDTLKCLSKALCKSKSIVSVGGRVLPRTGLPDFFYQKGFCLRGVLQGYQELEYGIAFYIVRPIFDKLGTSMLISGALGLFNTDVVIQLGGYALDTVGEDMELVMKIRRFAAESGESLEVGYAKEVVCFTELPWIVHDFIKQRIRWTVGLTDVLWKYREMAFHKKYSFLEKTTFWYYVVFEKFSPHIKFASSIMCVIFGYYQVSIALITLTVLLQILLSTAGSFGAMKDSMLRSKNKFRLVIALLLLMVSFVSFYQSCLSLFRLIAVPVYWIKKRIINNKSPGWISPTRM